jgi:hypothetical protein
MGRTPALPPPSDSTVLCGAEQPCSCSTSYLDSNGATSKILIHACGVVRSSSEVIYVTTSLEAQDNIIVVEQPLPLLPKVLHGVFLEGPTTQLPADSAVPIGGNHDDKETFTAADAPKPKLAPDENAIWAMYQQQLKTEVERMKQELVPDVTIVVADEVKTSSDARSGYGLSQRTRRWVIDAFLVLVVVGAGLSRVVFWVLQYNEEQWQLLKVQQWQLDPLVEELRSFIAPTNEDLLPFSDPTSAQSRAISWLHDDPITLTPGRSTATVLERYVLAVFNYSTSGWTIPYMSSESVCSWTGVSCTNGVVTALDLYSASIWIAGTFPWELVLLTNLITLDFSFSQFTGVIPTRINELTNMEILWMEHNLFSGPLIPDLPESLIGIYLHGNDFTGSIPDVWGSSLTNLQELLIYENQLTGTIPSSLGQISSLTRFEFGSNNITGSVDSFLCTGRSWSELIADCDKVVCTCCTICNS